MTGQPNAVLPYRDSVGPTSGWSGSSTSRDRAARQDHTGRTATIQAQVLALVRAMGTHGLTCHEAEVALVLGHGSASGALSNLHKVGRLARLTDRRKGQETYVAPDQTADRTLAPYRPNRANRPADTPDLVRPATDQSPALERVAYAGESHPEGQARTPKARASRARSIHVPGQLPLFDLPEESA